MTREEEYRSTILGIYINRSECLDLILYVNKLSNYLKECCE